MPAAFIPIYSTGWDPKDARELDRGQVAIKGSPEP